MLPRGLAMHHLVNAAADVAVVNRLTTEFHRNCLVHDALQAPWRLNVSPLRILFRSRFVRGIRFTVQHHVEKRLTRPRAPFPL